MPESSDKTISLSSPKAIKAACLKSRVAAPEDASELFTMEYTSPQGRMFEILEYEDGKFFMSEFKPTGRCVRYKESGDLDKAWDDDRITALLDNPNAVRDGLRALGVEDHVVRWGGGLSVGAILYDTLDDACEAIARAVRDNTWYDPVDRALLEDPEFRENLKEQDLMLREQYRQGLKEMEETASQNEHGLFKGLHAMMGPLSDDTKKRLLSFLNEPTVENWEKVYALCIKGRKTVWQAWGDVDPDAPESKAKHWHRIPDRDTFVLALRTAAGDPAPSADQENEANPQPLPLGPR